MLIINILCNYSKTSQQFHIWHIRVADYAEYAEYADLTLILNPKTCEYQLNQPIPRLKTFMCGIAEALF
jgi:hypothetical protein